MECFNGTFFFTALSFVARKRYQKAIRMPIELKTVSDDILANNIKNRNTSIYPPYDIMVQIVYIAIKVKNTKPNIPNSWNICIAELCDPIPNLSIK